MNITKLAMPKLEEDIKDRVSKLSSEDLIKMLEAPQDTYTSFAQEVAQQELDKRGVTSEIPEELSQLTDNSPITNDDTKRSKWRWVFYILFGFVLLSGISKIKNYSEQQNIKQQLPPLVSDIRVNIERLPPPTGVLKRYVLVIMGTQQAPLKITTKQGGHHFFVKLVDWTKGNDVLTLFIRSGESVSVEVPLGSYKMRYATGKQWYGETQLFGSKTSYNEADKKFIFEVQGNQVSGYTVELYQQPQGNLRTKKISAEQF